MSTHLQEMPTNFAGSRTSQAYQKTPYQALESWLCIFVVQSLSRVWLFVTPWTAAWQATLFLTISWALPWFMYIVSMVPSHPLLPLLLFPSVFPSIKVFSSESALCIRWPNYCSSSISPSNEHSELISFRIDWFGLLAFWGTLKSLLQPHSSKASFVHLGRG